MPHPMSTLRPQLKDRLVSQVAQPTSLNDKISVRSELRRAMGDLTSREAQIVEMRFGLADGNQMTLEEIGKHFCVTRERIRQVKGGRCMAPHVA